MLWPHCRWTVQSRVHGQKNLLTSARHSLLNLVIKEGGRRIDNRLRGGNVLEGGGAVY